jgi:hypothetical protein
MRASSRPSSMRGAVPRRPHRRGCASPGAWSFPGTWFITTPIRYIFRRSGILHRSPRMCARLKAQAGGVDGFILDYINRPDVYPTIYNIFAAAKQIHDADPTKAPFWLYVAPELGFAGSVQGNSASNGTGTNWILYFLQQFGSHQNYYLYNGNPVLGHF